MKSLDVAVVGGSIAGCFAAILLRRAGHTVTIYERSTSTLVGRGGGIGTPIPVLESLIDDSILGRDFPHLLCTGSPFTVRTDEESAAGRTAWTMPVNLAVFHWASLWHALRDKVPDECYLQGQRVVGADEIEPGRAQLQFADRSTVDADLVLFADGYRSLGRAVMFPEAEVDYRGYMLWRGLLPESRLADSGPLEASVPRLTFPDAPGHLVCYLVPGEDGPMRTGERIVNWASYISLPGDQVDDFMVDRDGLLRTGTIPPGLIRPEEEQRLTAMMIDALPDYYGQIVAASSSTYVQLIYTARVPAYRSGRLCLIGDAGSVAQPFTAAGVFKGHTNVSELVGSLETHGDLDAALDSWSSSQVASADRLVGLGVQMEDAVIWNPLDIATADAQATEEWFRAAVDFPDHFTYRG